jgi:transcriptional regulator with XRE-family HTH domain
LIRARRKDLKITQKQLAGFMGCTFQQIQKYECGRSNLSVQAFIKVCAYLRTNPNYFFSRLLLSESGSDIAVDNDAEARLLRIFRSIGDEKVKARIVELVEAVVCSAS